MQLTDRSTLLSFSILGVSLFLVFARIHFGVSHGDETAYVAWPYRFVLGDIPFLNELDFTQTSALLTYWFVKVHYTIQGNSDGLVLFIRYGSIAFSLFVGWVVYLSFRKQTSRSFAVLLGTLPLVFVPFSIHSLSYNTMGLHLLAMGLFIGLWPMLRGSSIRWLGLAGVLHGLMILAYPSLLFSALAFGLLVPFLYTTDRAWCFLYYALGGLSVGVLLFVLFPAESIFYSIQYKSDIYEKVWVGSKAYGIIRDLYRWGYDKLYVTLGAMALWLLCKRTQWALLVLPLTPLLCWPELGIFSAGQFATLFSLLAPLLLLFIWRKRLNWVLFFGVWIPSFVAGFSFAFTSTNATYLFGLGFFPTIFVTLYFIYEALLPVVQASSWRYFYQNLAVFLAVVFLLSFQSVVYQDKRLTLLTSKINRGPYQGIYTRPDYARFYEQLHADLKSVEQKEGKIVSFGFFGPVYLMTSMRPGTPSLWNCYELAPEGKKSHCSEYYREHLSPKNVAIAWTGTEGYDTQLEKLVKDYHRKVIVRDKYEIYSGRKEEAPLLSQAKP